PADRSVAADRAGPRAARNRADLRQDGRRRSVVRGRQLARFGGGWAEGGVQAVKELSQTQKLKLKTQKREKQRRMLREEHRRRVSVSCCQPQGLRFLSFEF